MAYLRLLAAAALVGATAYVGPARADQVFGVEVWIGPLASTQADAAHVPLSADTHATFTFTGAINWTNAVGTNLFQDFVPLANISNYAGNVSLAALGTTSLSTSGDAYSAFFQITGTYSALADYSGSVVHDDGASLYADYGTVFEHPNETAAISNNFTLLAGVHSFTLDYVEGNGSPSVLQIDFPADVAADVPVPEPVSMVLLAGGLAGLGVVRRRTR